MKIIKNDLAQMIFAIQNGDPWGMDYLKDLCKTLIKQTAVNTKQSTRRVWAFNEMQVGELRVVAASEAVLCRMALCNFRAAQKRKGEPVPEIVFMRMGKDGDYKLERTA